VLPFKCLFSSCTDKLTQSSPLKEKLQEEGNEEEMDLAGFDINFAGWDGGFIFPWALGFRPDSIGGRTTSIRVKPDPNSTDAPREPIRMAA
jgi:hypothetical protein